MYTEQHFISYVENSVYHHDTIMKMVYLFGRTLIRLSRGKSAFETRIGPDLPVFWHTYKASAAVVPSFGVELSGLDLFPVKTQP